MVLEQQVGILSSLMINGLRIESMTRPNQSSLLCTVYKFDKLGAAIRYTFLFSSEQVNEPLVQILKTTASGTQSLPILICDVVFGNDVKQFSMRTFFESIGGWTNTGLILIDGLPDIIDELGHNKCPAGLTGSPSDLLEIYTKEALQYLLDSPAKRYGQDRIFESLPDGLVLGKNRLNILFDAKAYAEGYSVSADDVKRYTSYVQDFNDRYSSFVGRVYSFTIVTGRFIDSSESLQNRRDELYRLCQTQLSCITARTLGNLVQLARPQSTFVSSVKWVNIFSQNMITEKMLEDELTRIKKDNIL
jgi:hypothetical protein